MDTADQNGHRIQTGRRQNKVPHAAYLKIHQDRIHTGPQTNMGPPLLL